MTHRYLDPTNDVAFKKLFSDKERLIDLLNALLDLPEGKRIKELDYIPQEQMPLFFAGTRSIFDLKVKDEAGRWYIVEMQRKVEKDYINRVQFYGSYAYVSQIEQGIAHKDLLPVIVISLIGQQVFGDELPYVSYHCFKEQKTSKQYLFSLTYVFVELGKFPDSRIKTDLEQWLHLFKKAAKEQEPPNEIRNAKVLAAYDALEQYKWTAAEHDAYIRSKLAMEAEEFRIEENLKKVEEAEARGEANGEAKGEAKGRKARNIEIAKEMHAKGFDMNTICEITKLDPEEIKKLK